MEHRLSPQFHPLDEDGNCALCKRRHHPGWGCPRWKKMSEARRKNWIRKRVAAKAAASLERGK